MPLHPRKPRIRTIGSLLGKRQISIGSHLAEIGKAKLAFFVSVKKGNKALKIMNLYFSKPTETNYLNQKKITLHVDFFGLTQIGKEMGYDLSRHGMGLLQYALDAARLANLERIDFIVEEDNLDLMNLLSHHDFRKISRRLREAGEKEQFVFFKDF